MATPSSDINSYNIYHPSYWRLPLSLVKLNKLHLWTQIRSNCHVVRFVVKRIIDQYKNRMFIHCRRGLYRKAWLSRDIYLSCVSQYWRGIKQAAMLTNRYGRAFQWGKSLLKDQVLFWMNWQTVMVAIRIQCSLNMGPSVKLLKNSK